MLEEYKLSLWMVMFVLLFFKIGDSMLDALIRPYIGKAVCLDMVGPANESLCLSLQRHHDLDDEVQRQSSRYIMYYRILLNVPAMVLSLFCGAWSDKFGRKIPMIAPCLGSVLSVLMYMLSVVYRQHALLFILVGAYIQGMFGKTAVITMAVHSYVADITEHDERTCKLGAMLGVNFFGYFLGALLAGILLDTTSFLIALSTVVIFHACALLCGIIFVTESPVESKGNTKESMNFFTGLFQLSNVKESLMVLCQKRSDNSRHILIIVFLIAMTFFTCRAGEVDVTILFVQRRPLSWPSSWYSYLLTIDYGVMGLSLFFLLPLLSNVLKVNDIMILWFSLAFKIIRVVWSAFWTESWMVYTAVIIGAVAGLASSAFRAILSKIVREDELGKVFALLACGETASKSVGAIIFTSLYSVTASWFPGSVFVIEACIYLILFVVVAWLYKEVKLTDKFEMMKIAVTPDTGDGKTYMSTFYAKSIPATTP